MAFFSHTLSARELAFARDIERRFFADSQNFDIERRRS